MMRGGAMRNRAPRFFVASFCGFVLWLTFVAHAECAEYAELFEHESHEFREFFGSRFFWLTQNARNARKFLNTNLANFANFLAHKIFCDDKYTKIVDLWGFYYICRIN